jgi:SpoVK/Ycf46/Vps4 family AAA+-type ATPase
MLVLRGLSGAVRGGRQVHAAGKPINRAGDAVWDADAVLHRTAELTIGYSGAELANLLNEAAILMARGLRPARLPGRLLQQSANLPGLADLLNEAAILMARVRETSHA